MNIETKNNSYSLLNIYAPNDKKSRNYFFTHISKLLLEHSEGLKLIGGDFNETLNNQLDRTSRSTHTTVATNKNVNLSNMIKEHNLTDIWRHTHPDKKQFTWRRKNNVDKSRIDYWLIENNLIPLMSSTDIRPAIIKYTDHMAISIKLKTPLKRGPGF